MELYRNGLKLTATIGLDESRGSVNVPVRLLHNENDEYLNYTEQIHIRYLFDNQLKEEILPTNDNGFYIPGKPLSHDGPIELAVHLINGNIELVTNELSFVVKNAPNGTTQVDPSEFTWQQLVDQYVNAKLDTFANKLDLSKFEEKVNGSIENQNQNIESFKTDVNANLSNQTTSINQTTSVQNSKITTLEGRMDTFTSLSEGSTTGDAELKDIRVGSNGITYNNAGDAVRGQYSQLKEDLVNNIGGYIHTVTSNSQYPHISIDFTTDLYIKIVDIDDELYVSTTLYGNTNEQLTELYNIKSKEISLHNLGPQYNKLDVYFNLRSKPTSDITIKAIVHPKENSTISDAILKNENDIIDINSLITNKMSGDLVKDIQFYSGKKLEYSDKNIVNIKNYSDFLVTSAYGGMVAKQPIKVRDSYGNLIKKLYFVLPDNYDEVTLMYCFDKNGSLLRYLEGKNCARYLEDDVYYILLIGYSNTIKNLHILYNENMKYVFEVGANKEYTTLTSCLKALKNLSLNKEIKIFGGEYDIYAEYGGDTFANSIASGTNWRNVSYVIPPNTLLIGIGYVTLKMTPTNISEIAGGLLSPLNLSGNAEIENIHIICSNCRYGIHIEGSNNAEFNNSKYVLRNITIERITPTGGINRNGPCIGIGLNGGCNLFIENCNISNETNNQCAFIHDNTFDKNSSPYILIKNTLLKTNSEKALELNMYTGENTIIDFNLLNTYVSSIHKYTSDNEANDIYNITLIGCNHPDITVDKKVKNVRNVNEFNVSN